FRQIRSHHIAQEPYPLHRRHGLCRVLDRQRTRGSNRGHPFAGTAPGTDTLGACRGRAEPAGRRRPARTTGRAQADTERENLIMNSPRDAVALFYDGKAAPKLSAKGEGDVAEEIVRIALEHGVPLYENAALAQSLATLELGDEIPEL